MIMNIVCVCFTLAPKPDVAVYTSVYTDENQPCCEGSVLGLYIYIYNDDMCSLRVETKAMTTMMKEMAVKDRAQYHAEMKELEEIIENDLRLKDFMISKCNNRTDLDDAPNFSFIQGEKRSYSTLI